MATNNRRSTRRVQPQYPPASPTRQNEVSAEDSRGPVPPDARNIHHPEQTRPPTAAVPPETQQTPSRSAESTQGEVQGRGKRKNRGRRAANQQPAGSQSLEPRPCTPQHRHADPPRSILRSQNAGGTTTISPLPTRSSRFIDALHAASRSDDDDAEYIPDTTSSYDDDPENPFQPGTPNHVRFMAGPVPGEEDTPLSAASEFGRRHLRAREDCFPPSAHNHQHHEQRSTHHQRNENRARRGDAAADVWTFFEEDPDNAGRNYCTMCKLRLESGLEKPRGAGKYPKGSYAGSSSTGTLRNHLVFDHTNEWIQACDKFGIAITADIAQPLLEKYRCEHKGTGPGNPSSTPLDGRIPFSKENLVDAIVALIAAEDLAVNFVESPRFRALILMLREELEDKDIPHRTKIRDRLLELWDSHIIKITKELQDALGKISITMDLWTDQQQKPFMAVTGHWIEGKKIESESGAMYSLKMRSELLAFQWLPGHHDGEHLADALLNCFDRVKMADRIGWVAMDNATNNTACMRKLAAALRARGIQFKPGERQIRCFPHVVNLVCQAVLGAMTNTKLADPQSEEFQQRFSPDPTSVEDHLDDEDDLTNARWQDGLENDPIAIIRAFVRHVRVSSLRRQAFEECLDTTGLKLLQLLHRALTLREGIELFLRKHPEPKYKLTPADWTALEVCHEILLVPHDFQEILAAEKTPTLCYVLPYYESMSACWKELKTKYPDATEIIDAGLDKLESYYSRSLTQPINYLATVYNPTIKMSFFQETMPECVATIKKMILNDLRSSLPPAGNMTVNGSQAPATQPTLAGAFQRLAIGRRAPQSHQTMDTEVDAYLLETPADPGTNPLEYWQMMQRRFPSMFKRAMDILPIQASAVPCERVFSSAVDTATKKRNQLGPATMEALQMLKYSVRHGYGLDFSTGLSRADQEADIMKIMAESLDTVEEKVSFMKSLVDIEVRKSMDDGYIGTGS